MAGGTWRCRRHGKEPRRLQLRRLLRRRRLRRPRRPRLRQREPPARASGDGDGQVPTRFPTSVRPALLPRKVSSLQRRPSTSMALVRAGCASETTSTSIECSAKSCALHWVKLLAWPLIRVVADGTRFDPVTAGCQPTSTTRPSARRRRWRSGDGTRPMERCASKGFEPQLMCHPAAILAGCHHEAPLATHCMPQVQTSTVICTNMTGKCLPA